MNLGERVECGRFTASNIGLADKKVASIIAQALDATSITLNGADLSTTLSDLAGGSATADWNNITNKPANLVDWTTDQGDTNIDVNNIPLLNYAPNTLASNGAAGLSSYNFTEARKNKLASIEEDAQVNVQSDWNATSGDALILNKPDLTLKQDVLTGTADVPGLDTALASKQATLSGTADVPGLDTALSGKQATLTSTTDVPGLTTALTSKQATLTGTSDVPGLDTALASKQATLTGTSDVPGLTTALSGKQATLTSTSDVPGLTTALASKQGNLTFVNSFFASGAGAIAEDLGTVTYTPPVITATAVGLGNVNNTSDANKPVSTAQQSALNLKANLAGASFTGAVGVTAGSAGTVLRVANSGGFGGVSVDVPSGQNSFVEFNQGSTKRGLTEVTTTAYKISHNNGSTSNSSIELQSSGDVVVNGAFKASGQLLGHMTNDTGLMGAKWSGYYNDNINAWYNFPLMLYPRKFTGINLGDQGSSYTWIWWGYAYSTSYQYWQFRTVSDDASHVYVNGTLVVNNGGSHGAQTVTSSTLNLARNTLHRIDIYHGELTGGAEMTFTWRASTDNSTFTDFAETLTAFRCLNAGPM